MKRGLRSIIRAQLNVKEFVISYWNFQYKEFILVKLSYWNNEHWLEKYDELLEDYYAFLPLLKS